jgi:uncharacterized membrane protein
MLEESPLEKEGKAFEPKRTVLLAFLITTMAYSLWLGGILLAPYLRSRSSPWAGLAYAIYRPVCHQVAERCLRCFGQPLAVCARCSGIYLGFLLGLGLYASLRRWRRLSLPAARAFFFVSAPIVLDTAANFLRLWHTPNAIRLATGVIWGTILPFYFVTGIADLFISRQKNRLKSAPGSP